MLFFDKYTCYIKQNLINFNILYSNILYIQSFFKTKKIEIITIITL